MTSFADRSRVEEASALFTSFPATFLGHAVDPTTVLLRLTRTGDANLDGRVTLQDFNRLAGGFGMETGAVWSRGDFNYDGRVNLTDFNLLAGQFGLSATGPEVSPADWSALASAVPEPAGPLALSLAAAAATLGRTRRPLAARACGVRCEDLPGALKGTHEPARA